MPSPRLVAQGEQRRNAIVKLIADYRKLHHVSPSIAEIAEAIGIEHSAVRRHVAVLLDEGRLTQVEGKHRTLREVRPTRKAS